MPDCSARTRRSWIGPAQMAAIGIDFGNPPRASGGRCEASDTSGQMHSARRSPCFGRSSINSRTEPAGTARSDARSTTARRMRSTRPGEHWLSAGDSTDRSRSKWVAGSRRRSRYSPNAVASPSSFRRTSRRKTGRHSSSMTGATRSPPPTSTQAAISQPRPGSM